MGPFMGSYKGSYYDFEITGIRVRMVALFSFGLSAQDREERDTTSQ